MNDTKLSPNDPRITAYALGEIEAGDREFVEAALRADPGLRATVEAIRTTSAHLRNALAEEAAQALPTENKVVEMFPLQMGPAIQQPDAVPPMAQPKTQPTGADPYSRSRRSRLFRFPQVAYLGGGLAAACFAVLAILNPPASSPAPVAKSTKVLVDMSGLVLAPTKPAVETTSSNSTTSAVPGTDKAGTGSVRLAEAGQSDRSGTAPSNRSTDGTSPRVAANPTDKKSVAEAGSTSAQALAPGSELPTLTVVFPPESPTARPRETGDSGATAESNASHATASPTQVAAQVPASGLSGSGLPANATVSGDKLYIPSFTMSADRLKNRSAAANQPPAEKAPATVASVSGGGGSASTAKSADSVADGIVKLDTVTVAERADNSLAAALTPNQARRAAFKAPPRTFLPESKFVKSKEHPYSTFLAEHDTASYFAIRQAVQAKHRPSPDSVRIEELLNYFPYHYAAPSAKSDAPIAATLEVANAPWAPEHRLVRIGLKAREVTTAERPAANLVFLLETSPTMNAGRLPLVKESLRLLLGKLRPDDRVAIVTYGATPGLVLPSTLVSRASEILNSLDRLRPARAPNGLTGIRLAYDVARANLVNDGINRVILCTGGDLNVGVGSDRELTRLVEEKAEAGVLLTVLGFGMGELRDRRIERLADNGNGMHGYIDSRKEAEKLLVQQVNGTLVMIAKDVKIQVDFNPSQVASYRLIGYENRAQPGEEIANNKVDAGEIGAGHTITALYEVIPANVGNKVAKGTKSEVEDRRYNFYSSVSDNVPKADDPRARELMMVRVSYKKPGGFFPRQLDFPLADAGGTFTDASSDFKFAAAVAGFGMILRESPYRGTATMSDVIDWAQAGVDDDVGGYRSDFIELARMTDSPEK